MRVRMELVLFGAEIKRVNRFTFREAYTRSALCPSEMFPLACALICSHVWLTHRNISGQEQHHLVRIKCAEIGVCSAQIRPWFPSVAESTNIPYLSISRIQSCDWLTPHTVCLRSAVYTLSSRGVNSSGVFPNKSFFQHIAAVCGCWDVLLLSEPNQDRNQERSSDAGDCIEQKKNGVELLVNFTVKHEILEVKWLKLYFSGKTHSNNLWKIIFSKSSHWVKMY